MFSLYQATIPSYRQILGSLTGLVDLAQSHCTDKGLAPQELIQARLAPDMHPFSYQIKSAAVHSLGAIEGIRKGSFSPDNTTPPDTFAALKARLLETLAGLEAVQPTEVNGWLGRDMAFVVGERRIEYSAEDFLLSFSQPNFYFHATTAYDILRWKGLPIGKRNFLGQVRKR
jgi:hypothetical protein